jgi:two-component system chemotaxis sensor kinase CheA
LENETEDEILIKQLIAEISKTIEKSVYSDKQRNDLKLSFPVDPTIQVEIEYLIKQGYTIFLIEKLINSNIEKKYFDELPIFEDITQVGKLLAVYPPFEKLGKTGDETVLKILIASKLAIEELENYIFDTIKLLMQDDKKEHSENKPVDIPASQNIRFLLFSDLFQTRNRFLKLIQTGGEIHVATSTIEAFEVIQKEQISSNPYHFFITDNLEVAQQMNEFQTKNDIPVYPFTIICEQSSADRNIKVNNRLSNLIITTELTATNLNSIKKNPKKSLEPENQLVDETEIVDFLTSANEIIEDLEQNIMSLENTKSDSNILEIFRLVHNLKGDAAFVSLKTISDYAHHLESMLVQLKNKELTLNADITDTLLHSNDFIKNALLTLKNEKINIISQEDVNELQEKIYAVTGKNRVENPKPVEINNTKDKVFIQQLTEYIFILKESKKTPQSKKNIIKRITDNLKKAARYNGDETLFEKASTLKQTMIHANEQELDELVTNIIEQIENTIAQITEKNKQKPIATEEKKQELSVEMTELKTIRVNEQKIESFFNLAGELLIARNTYDYLLNSHQLLKNNQIFKSFKENLHLFTRLVNDFRSEITMLRMIPLSKITQKFHRVVYDMARALNKNIEFKVVGDEMEVDKKVAEALSEPLIHIIRNACDHGIEDQQTRINAGKEAAGKIQLNAHREGSYIIIKVSDDGAGIDRQKIYEKAIKQNIDIEKYNDDSILDLIFEAGFSTKQIATNISGRGVGMDIVKSTLDKLNGSAQVQTEYGKGTEIVLKAPISIGTVKVLLIEVAGDIFAFPFESITKTIKTTKDKILKIVDKSAILYRDELIYLSLVNKQKQREIFDQNNSLSGKEELTLVIVQTVAGKIAFAVDKLLANADLAVKPLPSSLAHLQCFSGVSILGNGKVVLIINPSKSIN